MSFTDDKKYVAMEAVLQAINKSYISLAESHVKRNNPIIKQIIDETIIPKMKQQNQLFEMMYNNIYYGGSYYDGLKVGKPEEYDLDLLMSLPKIGNPQIIESDVAGYVYIQLPLFEKLKKQPEGCKYNGLEKLMDGDCYIITSKFRSWVEGLMQKVLNSFEKENKSSVVYIERNGVRIKFYIETAKNGPALTLKITGVVDDEKIIMDIDIVPSLKCSKWPESSDYRSNPSSKKAECSIVPKEPFRDTSREKYWRLSFQDQEREILNGHNKLKPIIRLIKRLRDYQKQDAVASYYIKTIFLLTLHDDKLTKCWSSHSLSYCFMQGLELYENHLRNYNIPFYWNTKNNLLSSLKEETCIGYANKIKKILTEINSKVELDPFIVAKYLLSENEVESLRKSVNLGLKVEKRVSASQLLQSCNSSANLSTNSSFETTIDESAEQYVMESLNLEMLGNSIDEVDCASSVSANTSGDNKTLIKILDELRSIHSKLAKIENKVNNVSERLKRLEKTEQIDHYPAVTNVFEKTASVQFF